MKRIAEEARQTDDVDEPRSLCSKTEKRLEAEGFKDSTVGVECTKVSTWKEKRQEVADKELFDFLVLDAVETHLQFYKENLGYKTDGGLIVAIEDGQHYSCPANIVKTYKWLMEKGAVHKVETRQNKLGAFA